MSFSTEEVVQYRLQRAKESFAEAEIMRVINVGKWLSIDCSMPVFMWFQPTLSSRASRHSHMQG